MRTVLKRGAARVRWYTNSWKQKQKYHWRLTPTKPTFLPLFAQHTLAASLNRVKLQRVITHSWPDCSPSTEPTKWTIHNIKIHCADQDPNSHKKWKIFQRLVTYPYQLTYAWRLTTVCHEIKTRLVAMDKQNEVKYYQGASGKTKQKQVDCLEHGRMTGTMSKLVLVLHQTNWGGGGSFWHQWKKAVKRHQLNAKTQIYINEWYLRQRIGSVTVLILQITFAI